MLDLLVIEIRAMTHASPNSTGDNGLPNPITSLPNLHNLTLIRAIASSSIYRDRQRCTSISTSTISHVECHGGRATSDRGCA